MQRDRLRSITLANRRRSSLAVPCDMSGMWSNVSGTSKGLIPGRSTLGPLILLTLSPVFVMVLHHTLVHEQGQIGQTITDMYEIGIGNCIHNLWPPSMEKHVWMVVGVYMTLQIILMKRLPGLTVHGPVSPAGNMPVYTDNGLTAFILTVALYCAGSVFQLYPGGILYDLLGPLLSSLNIFGLSLCVLLYLKGLTFPSTSDHGATGNPVFDMFWGTELYPRIAGVDIKQFTNCRCGMTFWGLFCVSSMFKQYEMSGAIHISLLVNCVLQLIYIIKFFYWEAGYLSTMDIAHDRAGFYLCWGCLVFLPCIYTSHTQYLVDHPSSLDGPLAGLLLILGLFCIYINYDVDNQKQRFRKCEGRCKIWNKDPFFIEARYKTEKGEMKTSLLLGSGWWGISRHFHYLPELGAAICWTVPVWTSNILPYFYIPYLVILLVDRAYRDDARCRSKYGTYWDQYCKHVPFMIVPGFI